MCKQVEGFLNYLKTIKNKSDNTIDGYSYDLNGFINYIKSEKSIDILTNEDFKQIQLSDLYSYMSYIKEVRKNGAYAQNRKVASIKSFFKYLKLTKIIDEDIAIYLESPKLPKRENRALSLEEAQSLLTQMLEDKNYTRDFCFITLLLNTGMRVSEAINIKFEDIKDDILTVKGKGDKERQLWLNNSCKKALKNWLVDRERKNIKEGNEHYIFISRVGKKISKETAENIVKKRGKYVGLDIHCHDLRKTLGTLIYEQTKDLCCVQDILGHNDISTSRIYIKSNKDNIINAMNNNPLNKI